MLDAQHGLGQQLGDNNRQKLHLHFHLFGKGRPPKQPAGPSQPAWWQATQLILRCLAVVFFFYSIIGIALVFDPRWPAESSFSLCVQAGAYVVPVALITYGFWRFAASSWTA